MVKTRQFRFYGDGDDRNYPPSYTAEYWTSFNILNGYNNITNIGIQAPSGMKMQINGNLIEMGNTGIFEINENFKTLNLLFVSTDLNQEKLPILVDIVYEE